MNFLYIGVCSHACIYISLKYVHYAWNMNLLTEGIKSLLTTLLQFRKLFPPTRWAAEFNAALTVPFFHWLVGPSEVILLLNSKFYLPIM